MNVAVIQFLGTNCEYDTKWAFELLGATSTVVWHGDSKIPANTDLVVIPGGFSYGDYLRSGAIARFANVMKSVFDMAWEEAKRLDKNRKSAVKEKAAKDRRKQPRRYF